MSVETAKAGLKQFGLAERVREMEQSSATVELAAQAVGVTAARIAKTLSFQNGGSAILVVTAGDRKIDNKKFKEQFGVKAKMLTPEEVVAYTGHAIGGVCPFGCPQGKARTYLDESLKRFATVFPAAGGSNTCIELSCAELEESSRAEAWVDVCKPAEG